LRILVCGVTGFVGSAIARHLLGAGHSVRGLSRSVERATGLFAADEGGRRALADGRLSFAQGDMTDPSTLPYALRDVEAVVQAAQFDRAPVEDPALGLTYERFDRDGTLNLLQAIAGALSAHAHSAAGAAARGGAASPRLFYMSGVTVSAEAPEPWNRAKWQAEEAIRASGLDWTIVRCCWAYGPGDKALNRLLRYSDYLPFVALFGPAREVLTPVFVEDIGWLFVHLMTEADKSRNTLFRLGGPDTVTLDEFLRAALVAMGRHRSLLHIPKTPAKSLARFLQHLPGRPLTPDAVDFVTQGGAVEAQDRQLLADRFPRFSTTPLRQGLDAYLRREGPGSYMPKYLA
jgi:uncharacterized protein YbjT (DUF2867 family)